MTEPTGFGPLLGWVVRRIVPAHRRTEVLGDLEASFRARTKRLGPAAARRHLWREALALMAWRARARDPLGTRDTTKTMMTKRRGGDMGRDLIQDLVFGLRTLGRRPAFATTAVLILGLGIGAPTTVLTLVNRIFFDRPAEVLEPHRLLRIYRAWAPGEGGGATSNPDYVYYRNNVSTLSGLAAYDNDGATVSYSTGGAEVDQARMWFVSDNYFDVLGVVPVLGRAFTEEENATPGTHPVAMLSYDFWRRAYGLAPDVAGREISLNGGTFTVVGVAPQDFRGLTPLERGADIYVPIAMHGSVTAQTNPVWWERVADNRSNWLNVVGRLAPGVSFEAAEANLMALSDALEYEGREEAEGVLVLRQFLYRPSQAELLAGLTRLLLGVVLIVLAIAAANVAVLLLFRITTRSREMGIRTAMGAGRGRLVRQVLAEALILGLAGGIVGMGIAYGTAGLAASLLPLDVAGPFAPSPGVLAAATGLSVLTALIIGIAPSLQTARIPVVSLIQEGSTHGRRNRLRSALVVGQMGLSLMLVAGAGLFARSLWAASSEKLGFEAENTLILQVNLRSHGYDEDTGLPFLRRALERVAAVPGVADVTLSRQVPFRGSWTTDFEAPPGAQPNAGENLITTGMNLVGPDYFLLMGIPLLRGRAFNWDDGPGSVPAIIINEALADAVWPGQDPVGRTLPLGDDTDFEVVGVMADATYYELGEAPHPQTLGSSLQRFSSRTHFLIRTAAPPLEFAPTVQAAIRELDANVAFGWVSTMDEVVSDQMARYQVMAVLVGLFAGLALILAAAGLYAVVSYLVAQRTREIGVRMALGADRGHVAASVLRSGLRLGGAGVALGLGGALVLSRFTSSLLYQVEPADPLALAGACATLLAVAAAASLVPARRATRVDPMEAIRAE